MTTVAWCDNGSERDQLLDISVDYLDKVVNGKPMSATQISETSAEKESVCLSVI